MYLMHKNAMDVCFKVMGTFTVSSTRRKHKGVWINLGYMGNPFPVGNGKLDINADNVSDWIVLTSEQVHTKRLKAGLPNVEA